MAITINGTTGITAVPIIANGTSNVTLASSSNVTVSVGGTANVLTVTTGSLIPTGNGTVNLGATGSRFNNIWGVSSSALYADLAERYLADTDIEPGTVVMFGGKREVMASNSDMTTKVAGVISTNPAYIMNDGLSGDHVVAVALVGRVPCKVVGPVRRGDLMVATEDGRARSEVEPYPGSIIGKALQDLNDDEGVIEIVVGKH